MKYFGDFMAGNFLAHTVTFGDFMAGDFMAGNFLTGNFMAHRVTFGDFMTGNFSAGDFLGGYRFDNLLLSMSFSDISEMNLFENFFFNYNITIKFRL